MALSYFSTFVFLLFLLITSASAQLSPEYYSTTCPNVLPIIKSAVASALNKEALMGASLLRMHFHDCFVNGCDASVLLDDTVKFTGEKTAPPNLGSLRGFEVIDDIKSRLEAACPGVVSCADILTVAARDSVVLLGGPDWEVTLGRKDSTSTTLSAVLENIPSPFMDLSDLVSAFSKKGFTAKDMVALSGSHSIGQARCVNFKVRIYNESDMDSKYATTLQASCPFSGGDNNLAPLDLTTPQRFDNQYYKDLVAMEGLLHSDQQLYGGGNGSMDFLVRAYASNDSSFRNDFANAMIKMGNLDPPPGTSGQVRTDCRIVNN